MILGIEKRTDAPAGDGDGDGDGDLDEETGIATTPLCVEYCDTVMGNCTGSNKVYAARASCINTCNALPKGSEAEALGNTVHCRLERARSAGTFPEDECIAAGPGGEPACGSNCEAWCHLLEVECPNDYGLLENCMNACGSIRDLGGFDVVTSYSTDDIQCRLIHLGAVQGGVDPIHCGHARYVPFELCVDAEGGEPSCDKYCNVVGNNCRGVHAVYESDEDCLAACEALPLGDLADTAVNTVGCRTYHAQAASSGADIHCDHAGPTGDGQCGSTSSDSGNCFSYCTFLQSGCTTEFDASFGSVEECQSSCTADFAGRGAANVSQYRVSEATEEDGLQCRVHYAVKALGGEEEACLKAVPGGTCD